MITTADCSAPKQENCTQAEKIYYGTYKFSKCEKELYDYRGWCNKGKRLWKEYKDHFLKVFNILNTFCKQDYIMS